MGKAQTGFKLEILGPFEPYHQLLPPPHSNRFFPHTSQLNFRGSGVSTSNPTPHPSHMLQKPISFSNFSEAAAQPPPTYKVKGCWF